MRVRQQSITQGRACRKQRAVNRKPSSKAAMHAMNMAKQARGCTRDRMSTSARAAVRRPSSICAQKGESAGRIARCQGPDLVLPSRCSVTLVEWVGCRSPSVL